MGGLAVFDLGWFGFPFFDELTAAGKFFVTRLREKTAYKVVEVLAGTSCLARYWVVVPRLAVP